jgi:hypothetical protein
MSRLLFSFAVLALLAAAQPAAAQDTAPVKPAEADREVLQALQLDPEPLALSSSLGAPATRNHCPPNYCNIGKQECAAECPGTGIGNCFHQFCEVVCYCFM